MTKIHNVESKIEDLRISMYETITIQVLNSFDSFFTQFVSILSHEAREKAKLSILESLVKYLEDEELQIQNQKKAIANYAKPLTKKKPTLHSNQLKDSQDPESI